MPLIGSFGSGSARGFGSFGKSFKLPTGGIITTVAGSQIHTFNSSGIFNPGSFTSAFFFIVGGGGGGAAGGGGAGAVVTGSITFSPDTNYSVIIGGGGVVSGSSPWGNISTKGSDSTAFGITADGGGWGGYLNYYTPSSQGQGGTGGSGGGSTNYQGGGLASTYSGIGTKYGNNGGGGGTAGGGGGAGWGGGNNGGGGGVQTFIRLSGGEYFGGGGAGYGGQYSFPDAGGGGYDDRGNLRSNGLANKGGGAFSNGQGGSGVLIIRFNF